MKEIIRRKIREALENYDWETRIEYEIDKIDLEEKIDEVIEETLDIKAMIEEYIEEIITDEIDNLDMEDII